MAQEPMTRAQIMAQLESWVGGYMADCENCESNSPGVSDSDYGLTNPTTFGFVNHLFLYGIGGQMQHQETTLDLDTVDTDTGQQYLDYLEETETETDDAEREWERRNHRLNY